LETNETAVLNETSQLPEWKPWGVERVQPLRAQERVQREHADAAEHDRAARVLLPVLRRLPDEPPLQRRRRSREDAREAGAERHHESAEHGEEQRDLGPAGDGHGSRTYARGHEASVQNRGLPIQIA
jgi:hypothetical protein